MNEEGKIIDIKKYEKYLVIAYKTGFGINFKVIKLNEEKKNEKAK